MSDTPATPIAPVRPDELVPAWVTSRALQAVEVSREAGAANNTLTEAHALAEQELDKIIEAAVSAKTKMSSSVSPLLVSGTGISRMRHICQEIAAGQPNNPPLGVNTPPPPPSRLPPTGSRIVGVLLVVVSCFCSGMAGSRQVTAEPRNPSMSVRDSMIALAKVEMVRKDVKREVALKNADGILTRVANQYGLTDDVLEDLGFCKLQLKDLQGLESLCARAFEQNPHCRFVYTYRGHLALERGDKKAARTQFETAIEKGDTKAYVLLRRCN